MIFRKINLAAESNTIESFLNRVKPGFNNSVLGYHYPCYGEMLEEIGVGQPYYFGAFNDKKIIAYLPGFIKKTKYGNVYSSLPFFGPNVSVLLGAEYVKENVHIRLLKELIVSLSGLKHMLSASFYSGFLANDFSMFEKSFKIDSYVNKFTQYLDIQRIKLSAEILYDIRKAKKNNVEIMTDINKKRIDDFFQIYKKNCEEFDIPLKPKKAIFYLMTKGVIAGRVKCYFAYRENTMIGGLIVIYGQKVVSYYLPCTISSERSLQSNSLLINFAIEEAKKKKIRFWNWESSPSQDSGVYRFKKKWGSLESNYRTYIKLFVSEEKIREIGDSIIAKNFPYFFVIPFLKN